MPIENLIKLQKKLELFSDDLHFLNAQVAIKKGSPSITPVLLAQFEKFQLDFENLPLDQYMKNGDTYRQRRFSEYLLTESEVDITLQLQPQQGFYQSSDINNYSGDLIRNYEPLEQQTLSNLFFKQLIVDMYLLLPSDQKRLTNRWDVGVHLYRITAKQGQPGLPVPEGAHRDGHAFTTITLINRVNVKGGESSFLNLERNTLIKHTLLAPLESAIFDDTKGLHDVTPIYCINDKKDGYRDICGFSFNPSC